MSQWYDSYINFPCKHLGQDPATGIDCFNLCKFVFKNELDIEIPYSSHDFCKIVDSDWCNKTNRQLFLEASNNGDWVEIQNLKPFDIILMSIGSTNIVNHCALYVGDNKILQTIEQRPSAIYNYHKYSPNIAVIFY